jgi:hypothetical protein
MDLPPHLQEELSAVVGPVLKEMNCILLLGGAVAKLSLLSILQVPPLLPKGVADAAKIILRVTTKALQITEFSLVVPCFSRVTAMSTIVVALPRYHTITIATTQHSLAVVSSEWLLAI